MCLLCLARHGGKRGKSVLLLLLSWSLSYFALFFSCGMSFGAIDKEKMAADSTNFEACVPTPAWLSWR